ncbi:MULTISPECIES: VOC family protein [unclassified Streptomyces]|uniref:VOC family protein n=1 Tax=unclassified Streptomyces TaxID=2593676 RepID=UPI0033E15140
MTLRDTPWPEGTPCWVEVQVDDPVRASAFYGQLFGWTFFDHGPDYHHYLTARLNGRGVADIGPWPSGEAHPGPPRWLVCFAVESTDTTAEKVVKAGGTLLLPPADVGTHGRFAVASDPAGARFALWQADEYLGSEIADVPDSVVWHHCLSSDAEASTAFYADVFGLSVTPAPGAGADDGHATLELDGRPVAGVGRQRAGVPSSWEVTFGVVDADAAVAKAVELGGSLLDGPFDTRRGRCALVSDQEGTPFRVRAVGGTD